MESWLRCHDCSGVTSRVPRASVTPIKRFSSRTGMPGWPSVETTANASWISRAAKVRPFIRTRLPLALA